MRWLKTLGIPAFATLLLGPSAAFALDTPVIRNEQAATDIPVSKITRVFLFYQEGDMSAGNQQTVGKGKVEAPSVGETGFYQFGEAMVAQAPLSFQKAGIVLDHASVVPPGEWKTASRKTLGPIGAAGLKGATLVTIAPRGGHAQATRNSATISITFQVKVVDAATAKVVWSGLVDTSTWNGRDFLTKNFQGTRFNPAYAERFLDTVMSALRAHGLV